MKLKLHSNEPETQNCILCDSHIEGTCLKIQTSKREYCLHPSCVVTGIAMAVNGISILISWFRNRKETQDG
ncbi:MAG: hypothetical protein SCARUB_01679 [Candidatus Scalindua rubra]|uniref:Uncharacterized protein n=1 Tax=Candidatus Scalindua rubra TaxID=1872076 RepID=A0A1E3XC41_9BACT|nr:MAG: hypothetical protein SCARUB_01679 [Candidatus Scalindua rubra]